jgi:hypothetical protein
MLCCDDFPLLDGPPLFTCTEGHTCCSPCFSKFIEINWSAQQRSVAEASSAQRDLIRNADRTLLLALPEGQEMEELMQVANIIGADGLRTLLANRGGIAALQLVLGSSSSSGFICFHVDGAAPRRAAG